MTNPQLITTPFAENGTKNTIPESGSSEPQLATMQAGFPEITQRPINEGGIPPDRADFNGILNMYGQHIVHLNKGLPYEFDQDFADKIGGYPLNARIMLSSGEVVQNTQEGNINNPNISMGGWKSSAVSKDVTAPTYKTAAAGVDPVTGVADGAYFNVRSTDDDTVAIEYQNVGGVATATGKSYLSALGVQQQEKPASTIKDANGRNQQEINDNLEVFIFPQNYGGKFDGVTDMSSALRAAALDAKVKNATMVLTGKAFVASSVDIDCNIDGRGAEIITPANSAFDVFKVNGGKDLTIGGFKLVKMGSSTKRGFGIRITGESENIHIHDVYADGYSNAVVASNDFDSTRNAIFKFSVSNTATGGTWKIGFVTILQMGEIAWTANLNHSATAAQLQSALDVSLGAGNTLVTKVGADYTIEFIGDYAGCYVPPPYLSYGLTGVVTYGGAVDIVQYGGAKFVKNLSLSNVVARNSGEYGLGFGFVDGLTINNCKATKSWFDGIKFIRHVRNVDIIGGYYCLNGESFFASGAAQNAGDGIDMYAGGENVRLFGGTYNFNRGVGIQIKNDDANDLSGYKQGRYGMCRNIEFHGVEASYNSVIGGLALTTNKDVFDSYAVTDVSIIGGRFEGNAVYGIGINGGQRVKITDVNANRNGSRGIVVFESSSDVEVNNCNAIANGSGAGTGIGLLIDGNNVRVNGGSYIGCDSDGITANTNLSGLIRHHSANIRVGSTAKDVMINMPYEAYNNSGRGILVQGSPLNITIHQKPTEVLTPNASQIYGSVGSTIILSNGIKYRKVSGTVSTGVWKTEGIVSSTNISSSSTITGGFDLHIIRAATQDVVVTLPKSTDCVGIGTKFMLFSISSPYVSSVVAQPGDTINGGVAAVPLSVAGSVIELTATSSGWIVSGKT